MPCGQVFLADWRALPDVILVWKCALLARETCPYAKHRFASTAATSILYSAEAHSSLASW